MADAVDTEVLFSGNNKYHVRFTNLSDGTGESKVTKVDRSGLTGPASPGTVDSNTVAPGKLVVEEIQYSINGFSYVTLEWEAGASDEKLAQLNGDGYRDYRPSGGLVPDTAGSAANGDILLSTPVPATANDSYDITMFFRLKA